MAEGNVFSFCQDFLANSVFVEHGIIDSLRFVSVYAHIVPSESLAVGRQIQAGALIGRVADTTGRKNQMPAHVHISLLRIPLEISADMLNWDFICNSDKIHLLDPLSMIDCEAIKVYDYNHWKEKGMIAK